MDRETPSVYRPSPGVRRTVRVPKSPISLFTVFVAPVDFGQRCSVAHIHSPECSTSSLSPTFLGTRRHRPRTPTLFAPPSPSHTCHISLAHLSLPPDSAVVRSLFLVNAAQPHFRDAPATLPWFSLSRYSRAPVCLVHLSYLQWSSRGRGTFGLCVACSDYGGFRNTAAAESKATFISQLRSEVTAQHKRGRKFQVTGMASASASRIAPRSAASSQSQERLPPAFLSTLPVCPAHVLLNLTQVVVVAPGVFPSIHSPPPPPKKKKNQAQTTNSPNYEPRGVFQECAKDKNYLGPFFGGMGLHRWSAVLTWLQRLPSW